MQKELLLLISSLIIGYSASAEVIVNAVLPEQRGIFGVKVIGEDITEVIMMVPQCIGGLGIKVEKGYEYTMKIEPNCKVDVPFKPIQEP
jgi:hypothetical protein